VWGDIRDTRRSDVSRPGLGELDDQMKDANGADTNASMWDHVFGVRLWTPRR